MVENDRNGAATMIIQTRRRKSNVGLIVVYKRNTSVGGWVVYPVINTAAAYTGDIIVACITVICAR